MDIINLAIVGLGVLIGVLGWKKLGGIQIPKGIAVIGCVALLAVGFYGYENIDISGTPAAVTDIDPNACVEFEITPSVAASEAVLSSDETTFTVAAYANTTAHTITESDNTTWVNPQLQFVCSPIITSSAATDIAYPLFYEVINPEVTTDDGTDTYKLFTKSDGNRQLIWTGDGTKYVDSSVALTVTQNVTLTLTMTCSQDSYSRMENTYDPVKVMIRFYNVCGWSETYTVGLELVHTYT